MYASTRFLSRTLPSHQSTLRISLQFSTSASRVPHRRVPRPPKMSWMDSWSRPSKSQATPAPFYLLPGGESTPYCHSCGRVIGSRRTAANQTPVKYCSSRCRNQKPGKLDREVEQTFVRFLTGQEDGQEAGISEGKGTKGTKGAKGKKHKGDPRILVSCNAVERSMFGASDHGHDTLSEDEAEPEVTTLHNTDGSVKTAEQLADAPYIDGDVLARMSIRSGTRIRPPQAVSEVNGSVGGEKGRSERIVETEEMLEKRRIGQKRAKEREMVRCAARRGVAFGFAVDEGADRKKCEAVMRGKVVEPSFAKGDWSIRWRE